jgi:hypothetical protein
MRRLITPQPGFSLADCDVVLKGKQMVTAECYTITPTEGAVMRLTNMQEDCQPPNLHRRLERGYSARQAVISGLKMHSSIGIEVDDQDIEINWQEGALFQNWKTWPVSLLYGRLDGATISRDIAFKASFEDDWVGVTRLFTGGDVELDSVGRTTAKLKVNSGLARLGLQMPQYVYGIKCRVPFGGFLCGIDLNTIAVLGTVGVGATTTTIPWSSAGAQYAFGKIHITNSDSVTRVRTILAADSSHLYLKYPLDFVPDPTLQFTAFPGCSHLSTGANGCSTYWGADWPKHFAGTPFTPVVETAA